MKENTERNQSLIDSLKKHKGERNAVIEELAIRDNHTLRAWMSRLNRKPEWSSQLSPFINMVKPKKEKTKKVKTKTASHASKKKVAVASQAEVEST